MLGAATRSDASAGISRCAGEPSLPSEKTSDTVPISLIGPVASGGFVEL